jgi:hypothetical protein
MADQAREATGVWMLRSAYLERTDTRERILPYGDHPRGVLILHEGGRMAAIITPSAQTGDVPPLRRKLLAYYDCAGSLAVRVLLRQPAAPLRPVCERGSIRPDVRPGRTASRGLNPSRYKQNRGLSGPRYGLHP